MNGPRVLLLDIETAPILAYVWGLWENNVALNQIHTDWYVLSWAAKWLDEPDVLYMDQRDAKNIEDDKAILTVIWNLLDEADVIITQNGRKFDQKKLNTRFLMHGFKPPSTFKHIDTLLLAKRHFGFTSNKLEYMSDKLCKKFKKLKHAKFPGFELWKGVLTGKLAAWNEMQKYNTRDVLALEELWRKLSPWDSTVNFSLYYDDYVHVCRCGSADVKKQGWAYTQAGKYQRYRCRVCGAESRDRYNVLTKGKRASLHANTPR